MEGALIPEEFKVRPSLENCLHSCDMAITQVGSPDIFTSILSFIFELLKEKSVLSTLEMFPAYMTLCRSTVPRTSSQTETVVKKGLPMRVIFSECNCQLVRFWFFFFHNIIQLLETVSSCRLHHIRGGPMVVF